MTEELQQLKDVYLFLLTERARVQFERFNRSLRLYDDGKQVAVLKMLIKPKRQEIEAIQKELQLEEPS